MENTMSRTQNTLVCLLATLVGLNACATSETALDVVERDMQVALQAGDYDLAWQIAEDYAGTPFNAVDRPPRESLAALMVGEYMPHPELEGATVFVGRMLDADDITTHIIRGERLSPVVDQERGMMTGMTEAAEDSSLGVIELDYSVGTDGGRLRGTWMTESAMGPTYARGTWTAETEDSGRFVAGLRHMAPPTWDNGIRIRAEISGRTLVVIESDGLFYHHVEGAAPGTAGIGEGDGSTRPTNINGEQWEPTWPAEGDATDCDCNSDTFYPADGATIDLAGIGTMEVAILQGRGDVTLVQQPTAENEYRAVVLIDDNAYAGAGSYEIGVRAAR
jgi:hypothetical protein